MPNSNSTTSADSLTCSSQKPSYWAHMVTHYEKRNASLEQRQTELAERIRLMECAVPSLLMGAMVTMKRNTDPKAKLLQTNPRTNEQSSTCAFGATTPTERKLTNRQTNETSKLKRATTKSELNRFCKNTDFRP